MSYIGHRCACGHADSKHKADAGRTTCEAIAGRSCRNGCRRSTKAVLIPTFDGKGRQVETITAPGDRLPVGFGGRLACSCDNCQALHDQLTAA